MRILFVSSGRIGEVGEVVKNQGESLVSAGMHIDFYTIQPGLRGYLSSVLDIRRTFYKGKYDLAHAHYSLSAFAAALAGCSRLVVSLMGSDVYMSGWIRVFTRIFNAWRWDAVIVKTEQMRARLNMPKAHIIPNGVDLSRFKPIPKKNARKHLAFSADQKIVLFISRPNRPEKNADLAEKALNALDDRSIELKHIYNVPNAEIPFYLGASDTLLLTSKWEGSVNVIKEAMACNCPIVTTPVGDTRWVVGETEGCFFCTFDERDVAVNIEKAISFGKRTNGRERIQKLGLDSHSIADRIAEVYHEVLKQKSGRRG